MYKCPLGKGDKLWSKNILQIKLNGRWGCGGGLLSPLAQCGGELLGAPAQRHSALAEEHSGDRISNTRLVLSVTFVRRW